MIYALRVPRTWFERTRFPRLTLAYWLVRMVFARIVEC